MAKNREILYHLIFWTLFIGLDLLLEAVSRPDHTFTLWSVLQLTLFSLLQITIFYLNYLFICPRTVPARKWLAFAFGQLFLIALFPALRYLAEEVIIFNITGIHNYNEDSRNFIYYFYDNSFYVIRIVLLSVVFYMIKYAWESNAQVSQLQLEKKQAELQVLKNQLSPHFLFNTLNSFYSDLFESRPEVAEDILKLSGMLRYVTYENQNDKVLLKDEIEFIRNYIDLFKRRFDNAVSVSFTYPEDPGLATVPSLLLIHFVENAFKHGTFGDELNPVSIIMRIEGSRLIFTVTNDFKERQHYDEPGIGHKNISQRLSLMYAGDHQLRITEDQHKYSIMLDIPLSL